jgi:pantoate--beta-alanine ligase
VIAKGAASADVVAAMREIIDAEPLAKIDYVSVVDALDMQPVDTVEKDVLVATAVYSGKTRLIDNFSFIVD